MDISVKCLPSLCHNFNNNQQIHSRIGWLRKPAMWTACVVSTVWNAQCFLPCLLSDSVEGQDTHPLHWDLLQGVMAGLLWCFRMCPQTQVPLLIQSNDIKILMQILMGTQAPGGTLRFLKVSSALYQFPEFCLWWNSTPASRWAVETWENRPMQEAGITAVPTTTASAIHFNHTTWGQHSTKMLVSSDFKHQREQVSFGFDLDSLSQNWVYLLFAVILETELC